MSKLISYVLILSVFLYVSCGKPQSDEKDIDDATLPTTDSSVNSININYAVEKEQADNNQFDYENLSQEIKEAIPFEFLQVRQKLIYEPNTKVPYSGTAFLERTDNEKTLGLIVFEKGKIHRVFTFYANGQLRRFISLISSNKVIPETITSFYEEPYQCFWHIVSAAEKNMDGLQKRWYENGQLNETLQFTSGSLIEAEVFRINGEICEKTTLSSGNGKFAEYYGDTGELYSVASYANGKKDGEQTTYFSDGVISLVESYLNGKLDGEQTTYFSDGVISLVESYLNGEKHGKQMKMNSDGEPDLVESYLNGKKHGYRINYDKSKSNYNIPIYYEDDYPANGLVSIVSEDKQQTGKGLMVDGKRDGEWTLTNNKGTLLKREKYNLGDLEGYTGYFPTGEVQASGPIKNGEKHGDWAEYSEGEKNAYKGKYIGGLKNGDWTLYNKDNALLSRTTYKGDIKSYEIIYFENGEIKEEGVYFQGKKHGLWKITNTSNESLEIGKYINDLKNGLWIEVKHDVIETAREYESGNLIKIIENDEIYKVIEYDEVITASAPAMTNYMVPEKPFSARKARISGKANVRFIVDHEGNVSNVEVTDAHDFMIEPIIKASKHWKMTTPSNRFKVHGERYYINDISEMRIPLVLPIKY